MALSSRAAALRDAYVELSNLASRLHSNPFAQHGRSGVEFKHWVKEVQEKFTLAESQLSKAGLLDQRARLAAPLQAVRGINPAEALPITVTFENSDAMHMVISKARERWADQRDSDLQVAKAQIDALAQEARQLWDNHERAERVREAEEAERKREVERVKLESAEQPTHPRLRLEKLVGQGGFGDVWSGHDGLRPVAVKLCRPEDGAAPGALDHARALAEVSHSHIAQVYYVGRVQDPASKRMVDFVAMELVDGPTLGDLLRGSGSPAVALIAEIGRRTLEALAFLHEKEIPHGDLHADNVMLSKGAVPKLIDPIFRGTLSLSSARCEYRLRSDMHNMTSLLLELLDKVGASSDAKAGFHRAAFAGPITLDAIRLAFDRALERHPVTSVNEIDAASGA